MFQTFDNQQLLEPGWNPLFKAANLQLRFLGRGEELQLLCNGERALSVTLNSKPFFHKLPTPQEFEVSVGFGQVTKADSTLRVSLGGKFDALSADETINPLKLPGFEMPTMLIFVQKPFSTEKAVFGFQFMGQIPAREIPVDIDDPSRLDTQSFRTICENSLGVPKEF